MDETKVESLINRLMNATDPTRDAKLMGYMAGVVSSIIWLSITLRPSMNEGWRWTYAVFMGSVSLGGAVWTAVDKFKGKQDGDKKDGDA